VGEGDHRTRRMADDVRLSVTALAEGTAPGQVFAQLALGESHPRQVALAVCVAIGIPRPEAERRLEEFDGADPEAWNLDRGRHSREENASSDGEILESTGLFDLHFELDADQRRIAELLAAALAEINGTGSGHAFSYERAISTGRLRDAFMLLSRPGRIGREVNTASYWQRLVTAADLLGADSDAEGDAEYVDAVRHCRDRLAHSR
jgi:hypothetical protein